MAEKKKYTYFKTVKLDDDGNEIEPTSIHRATKDFSETSRYDHINGKWVYNSNLIAATGIGGDNPYDEIDEKEAIEIVKFLVAKHKKANP